MRRALLLRAIGLGDLLTGVPAFRAARRALLDHEIVLAAPEVQRPLVGLCGAVDVLLPTGELEPLRWSGPPPDIAIDLHGNGPASRRLVEALEPAQVVAFHGDGHDWRADEHETSRWCRLVSEAFGVPADPSHLRLPQPLRPPLVADAVVVHPGAASASRRWPAHRFAAVAAWAAEEGEPVVVTGSSAEAGLVECVRRGAGLPAESSLAGRTDLVALASLVAHARLVVSGDTGVAHLASAFGTPSVVLFGPIPPSRWGPPRNGPHTAIWHGTSVGDPHGRAPDPALLRIGVTEVVEESALRLRSGRYASVPGPSRRSYF